MDTSAKLRQALTERCRNRPDGTPTLRCADAFALAREFSLGVHSIGDLCNEEGIKIVDCQLGCFR